MFGFFSKKNNTLKTHDCIWLTEEAKFKACADLAKKNPDIVFVAWFKDSKRALQNYFNANGLANFEVYLADYLNPTLNKRQIIFIEHHPLQSEEKNIAEKNELTEITVYSALSEPLFKLFNADGIVEMMRKMGMKDDEMLNHNMITNSIKKAQEKVASKIIINSATNSQGEWLLNAGLFDSSSL